MAVLSGGRRREERDDKSVVWYFVFLAFLELFCDEIFLKTLEC